MNHEQLWKNTSDVLRRMVNADLYSRWFQPIRAVKFDEHCLQLGVANEFSQIWLQDNFASLIQEALAQVTGHNVRIKFVVTPHVQERHSHGTSSSATAEKTSSSHSARVASVDHRLNPKYTFDSFVVGPNSNFAHAACLAVAQSPAKAYNPLFIYGGVGLGKTHLMQAIGHAVLARHKNMKVFYVTSETFTNEYIHAIQTNTVTKFRKKYRQVDLLLIDDVHFLAGKERLQEEFFHTFNTLFDSHSQIVLSSDRPAAEIANLEHRLVSRFEWGLVTELQPPALETRIAILKKKAQCLGIKIPDETLEFIAAKIRSNIRRLEGALVRVTSYASLTGRELTLSAVETLLRDALHEEARHNINIDSIQRKVAEYFDVRLADMTSRRRPQNVAFPRQIAMYLSRNLTGSSFADIGEAFGGRDHGTVMHACKLVENRLAEDQALRQTISYLQQQLQR
jgi:chromosomal replication initiator protein